MFVDINLNSLLVRGIQSCLTRKGSRTLGLFALTLFIGYAIAIKPQREAYQNLLVQNQALKKSLAETKMTLLSQQGVPEQVKQLRQHLRFLSLGLIEAPELPKLLSDISKTGLSAGLKDLSLQPKPSLEGKFFKRLPIHIQALGSYQQLKIFLRQLFKMKRIIGLRDFSLSFVKAKNALMLKLEMVAYISH